MSSRRSRSAGYVEGDNAQAVEEVFPELRGGNGFLQVFICGGDDANIHIIFFGAPKRTHFSFLKHTIEFYLHGLVHVADFVHEQRAAVRPPGRGRGDFRSLR